MSGNGLHPVDPATSDLGSAPPLDLPDPCTLARAALADAEAHMLAKRDAITRRMSANACRIADAEYEEAVAAFGRAGDAYRRAERLAFEERQRSRR